MTISIVDHGGLLDSKSRPLAKRRLLFALSRFDSRIVNLELIVGDESGPRGSVGKSARVFVSLKRAADVVVAETDTDLARCLSRVADKAGRAVARAIQRTQSFESL